MSLVHTLFMKASLPGEEVLCLKHLEALHYAVCYNKLINPLKLGLLVTILFFLFKDRWPFSDFCSTRNTFKTNRYGVRLGSVSSKSICLSKKDGIKKMDKYKSPNTFNEVVTLSIQTDLHFQSNPK